MQSQRGSEAALIRARPQNERETMTKRKPKLAHPAFDRDGYPSPATLQHIRSWPAEDPRGLVQYLCEAWWPGFGRKGQDGPYYRFAWRGGYLRLATGGWSGNEDIVEALSKSMFWVMRWRRSERGGLHIFKLPKEKS